MIKLFTEEDFLKSNSNNKLPLQCYQCNKTFYLPKVNIQRCLNPNHKNKGYFCSKVCYDKNKIKSLSVNCKNCNVSFKKTRSESIKYPNHFCCRSCAATYNNKNKTHGTRRSKMEFFLEERLSKLFPDLKFNDKTIINSELDIFHPSLKLAFEINGIFHYKPIYGEKKLKQIQKNDEQKKFLCRQNKIELTVIDISDVICFTPKHGEKFLSIIVEKINNKSKNICTP